MGSTLLELRPVSPAAAEQGKLSGGALSWQTPCLIGSRTQLLEEYTFWLLRILVCCLPTLYFVCRDSRPLPEDGMLLLSDAQNLEQRNSALAIIT